MTLEITPTAFNIQLIATLSLEIFWSGFRLEHFSPGYCVAFFTFKVATYLNFQVWESFPTFHKFSFTVFITVQMTSILWPNCYLGRVSPLFVPQIGVILLPFFALTMWGLSTSLSIWSSKSDPHHHVYTYHILFSSTGIGLWGVSCRVNANCSCPFRSRIRVNANCSYPWTPISLECWVVFIKTIYSYLIT